MPQYKVFVKYGEEGIYKTANVIIEAETGKDAEQIASNMYHPVSYVEHTRLPDK